MKSNKLLVLACLFSMPVFSQSLPDEINYAPYEARYRTLERETSQAEAALSASRASLAEARRFIREMTAHIASLESQIAEDRSEISRLRSEIPELERQMSNLRSEDSSVMNEMRNMQNEESNLVSRYQQAQRDLRPLEDNLNRKEMRLRDLVSELNQYKRAEAEAQARLNRAQSEAQRIDRQHAEARDQIRQFQEELRSIDGKISSVQSQISSAESSISGLQNNLRSEEAKLGALNSRVAEYESEVSRLRSAGAPAEEIAQAERKLNASRNARDNTASEIRNLQSQISRTESQIRSLNSQIDDLRRTQSTLPSRISQAESRMRQLESERNQTQSEIQRYSSDLSTARRNVEVREGHVASLRNEIRVDEQTVLRQRQFIENLGRQIETVRSEIASLSQRSRNINAEIARLSEIARSHTAAIPRLEQGIREAQSEISEGQRDLISARNDERTYVAAVSRDEAALSDVTGRRNAAQSEMQQRLSLYNKYLDESERLGSSQSTNAIGLGEKEGQRLSGVLSKQNGVAVGKELGLSEAKYWGSVRGELQGYDLGYSEGLNSGEDISRATQEAQSKAAADAELFAQTNFKPVFFEEFVQEEFKKPLVIAASSSKGMKLKFAEIFDERSETVPPLSPNEIARSESLKTPLDGQILQFSKDVKLIEAKAKRLSDPKVTFVAPTSIPFGAPACTAVYKNLPVFKAACEGSYKSSFTQHYVSSAEKSYSAIYTDQFRSEFDSSSLSQRETSFPVEFAGAHKVGKAEGMRIGKIEIYQTTFENVYKSSYVTQLEIARAKSKVDARRELTEFLNVKPLLTTAKTELLAENFRGGEEITLAGSVKNIGKAALNGPVIFRVTELVNAEKVVGESVLNSAAPQSVSQLLSLKVKVSASAKAGDKVIVRGVLDLPGDLYKPARQEKFELSQVLSANPAHDLALDFNKTPEIKGVFRRYIHFMTTTIAPKVEDIKDGYKLTLVPAADSSAHVEMKDASFETGALKAGTEKEVRFSYVFKDSAKGKTISFEMAVTYLGKVIKKETVAVVPK